MQNLHCKDAERLKVRVRKCYTIKTLRIQKLMWFWVYSHIRDFTSFTKITVMKIIYITKIEILKNIPGI